MNDIDMEKLAALLSEELVEHIVRMEMRDSYEMAQDKKDRKAARRMHNYYAPWGEHI